MANQVNHLEVIANDAGDRETQYVAYREYYDGDHDTQLTERQRRYLQLKMGEEFRANYCSIVADVLVERLRVTGFHAGEEEVGQSEQGAVFWQWWKKNRMDNMQTIVHLAAVRDGDAYVMVEWDNDENRPRFTFEPAFDGSEGVKCHYSSDERGKVLFATKRWTNDDGQQRVNFYFEDRIEKYVRGTGGEGSQNWRPYSEGGEAVIRWVEGQPLGIPVVHFKNKDQGYNYGASELRDVVPLQNALNKAIIDLVAAADTTGFRVYYMIGDDPSDLHVTPGGWVYTKRPAGGDEAAEIGYFPGEDLSKLIDFKDAFGIEIARVSRTPISYFQISAQRAAEGTLKQEEVSLVAKAKHRHVGFGNHWEDVMAMGRKLYNAFGEVERDGEMDEDVDISTIWADPQTRNERVKLEELAIKRKVLKVPSEVLWLEAGYSPEEIEVMKESEEYQTWMQMQWMALTGDVQGDINAERRESVITEIEEEQAGGDQSQRLVPTSSRTD